MRKKLTWLVLALLITRHASAQSWLTTGNSGLSSSTHFIGTIDNVPLIFKVGNVRSGIIDNTVNNVAIGYSTLQFLTTGRENSAFGHTALHNNSGGSFNVAVGSGSLFNNTAGSNNTAVGHGSLLFSNSGHGNTAIGSGSLLWNTYGNNNNAFGQNALLNNTTGSGNISIGYEALYNNTTGSFNIAIGHGAGTYAGYFNNTISIGNIGWLNGYHNQVFIGNQQHQWIGGWVGWSVYSDERIKTNITENVKGLEFIMKLRPVTYNRSVASIAGQKPMPDYPQKYDAEKIVVTGFIAQEVEKAANEAGYNFSGVNRPRTEKDLYSLSYESFVVPLVKAVQEQQQLIEKLNSRIDELEKRIGRGSIPAANPYTILPNPASGFSMLHFRDINDSPEALVLYNSAGSKVWSQTNLPSGNSIRIPMQNLPAGVYHLSVFGKKGQYSLKLIQQ
jgi:hypothetical protein